MPATQQGHQQADHILRRAIPYYWPDAYEKADPFDPKWAADLDKTHRLEYPAGFGFGIAISFTTLKSRTDVVRVRSTNWRCEHEPSGLMKIEAARKLYRELVATGMEPF
jgi:hypothetical protein